MLLIEIDQHLKLSNLTPPELVLVDRVLHAANAVDPITDCNILGGPGRPCEWVVQVRIVGNPLRMDFAAIAPGTYAQAFFHHALPFRITEEVFDRRGFFAPFILEQVLKQFEQFLMKQRA